jgi:hypothetical protein
MRVGTTIQASHRTSQTSRIFKISRASAWTFTLVVALGCMDLHGFSQTRPTMQPPDAVVTAELPNAPDTLLPLQSSAQTPAQPTGQPADSQAPTAPLKPARRFHRVVRPYEYAQPLSAGDKLKLSIMSRLTLGEAGATVIAAGWSQWRDSRPHFGTDRGAFGERLGALAIKQTSQSIFSYGVFAAAFHDDPRYYVIGPSQPLVRRAVDSALTLVITRKDDGRRAVNWPKFAGIAAATALTNAYYPTVDHGFGNSSKAFATSLGTSILNSEMHEFTGDAMRLLRHRH